MTTNEPCPTQPSEDDIRRCAAVLESIHAHPGVLAGVPRDVRVSLLSAAGRVAHPDPLEKARLVRGFRRQRKDWRLAAQRQVRDADRAARSESQIRVARRLPVFVPPEALPRVRAELPADAGTPGSGSEAQHGPGASPRQRLARPQNCYICKLKYDEVHEFYDALCSSCGDFNRAKRLQTARLDGRVAVVTGGRVKIGFHIALKLLRAGAHVVVTTRFPRDAASRFLEEADASSWTDRLEIHGLDLRHAPSVEIFARYLETRLDRLDYLINNACQTVRRPPGFYHHLLEIEEAPAAGLSAPVRSLIASHETCKQTLNELVRPAQVAGETALALGLSPGAGLGLRESARLSQQPYAFEEGHSSGAIFPVGRFDADLQQVDLRAMNSWRLRLGEVPTPELLEVHLVNAVAPFILCAKLKPLMMRDRTDDKHIVNVSAMEGKFNRGTKTDRHPHTNMAKAALNMMTLTSAPDYARDGIFMNAVDTGWVTDEDPAIFADRKREELDFQPPLDIIDGAARVCDPIFSSLLSGMRVWGLFLKDYRPTDW